MKYELEFYDHPTGNDEICVRMTEGSGWVAYFVPGGTFAQMLEAGMEWIGDRDKFVGVYHTREEAYDALDREMGYA